MDDNIMAAEYADISFGGASGTKLEQMQRRARTLFSVIAGTLPMDRDFGIAPDAFDEPISVAQNIIALEVTEKVARYLPGCDVDDIECEYDGEGRLRPHVTLTSSDDLDDGDDWDDDWDDDEEDEEE